MSLPDSVEALFTEGVVVWGFLLAAAIVLALTPLAIRVAPRIGALDLETDRPRVHNAADPAHRRAGDRRRDPDPGCDLRPPRRRPYLALLIGTFLVAVLGLIDDTVGMRPSVKLLGVSRWR